MKKGKHSMRIADLSGDTTITWETTQAEQVQRAQSQFEELVNQKHFQAFAFKQAGQDGEIAKTFDPQVHHYVIMPQAVGG